LRSIISIGDDDPIFEMRAGLVGASPFGVNADNKSGN
jgi:hypothetical protein